MKAGRTKNPNGFTLAELLVAMTVSGIILGAVASLAYALGRLNDNTDELCRRQAHLRCATTILSQLIRHSKLVCSASDSRLAVWALDENDVGRININELVYIVREENSGYLELQFFDLSSLSDTTEKSLDEIAALSPADYIEPVTLISECSDIQFECYESNLVLISSSPWTRTKLINITFGITEEGIEQQYQINAALRCRAENLLDLTGDMVAQDDD